MFCTRGEHLSQGYTYHCQHNIIYNTVKIMRHELNAHISMLRCLLALSFIKWLVQSQRYLILFVSDCERGHITHKPFAMY